MVTVFSSLSPVPPVSALAFPYLHAAAIHLDKSPDLDSTQRNMAPAEQSTTSVFKALGSYADRIRENGGESPKNVGASSSTSAPAPTASTALPASGPSGSAAASASASKPKMPSASMNDKPVEQVEDDGPWETVQSARVRTKQEKEREREQDKGSNSRNWRDRPQREKAGNSSKEVVNDSTAGGDSRKGTVAATTATSTSAAASGSTKTKRSASSAPTTRAGSESGKSPIPPPTASTSTSKSPTTASAGPPAKSAWSVPMTSQQRATASSTTAETSAAQPAKAQTASTRSQTAPSSPSLTGTTVANSSIGDASVASPNLSSDTYASSTPPTSAAAKEGGEDEGKSWRSRTTTKSSEKSQEKTTPAAVTVAPPVIPKPAPPPTVNAWAARQQKASTSTTPVVNGALAGPTPASASNEGTSKPTTNASASAHVTAARLQFGDVSPSTESPKSMPNGQAEEPVKIGGKKKKKDAASVVGGQTLVMDASQWPDVATAQATAAETAKADGKKEVKQAEEQAEEGAATRKPKWTPIPASELLAAADEAAAAAEASKRQTRKRGSKHGESSVSPAAKTAGLPNKPKKGDANKRSEIRLPPNPNGQAAKGSFKPTFGSLEPGSEGAVVDELAVSVSELSGGEAIVNGTASVPLSRQTSKSGQPPLSPTRSLTDPSVPLEQAIRFGSGPLKSQPMHQNATAPLPQNPFAPSTSGNLPRPPRGGRSSFSGRGGRGGHRGGRGGFDPSYGAGGNLYAQGYGMGYNPAAAGGAGWNYGQAAGQQTMFDPMQAQWFNMQMYGRGPMPPPPTPQTVVSTPLEPLRYYVLGQIEYYFSMQNLAMDFFLRQQMDTEGWISIAMIASFNRIRSLTPEVPIIKEMMEQSSLLEVQGDHVRLKEDAKKWVLPDAKRSPFPPATPAETAAVNADDAASSAVAATSDLGESASQAESMSGSGLPDDIVDIDLGFPVSGFPDSQYQPGAVAHALMKSNANASTGNDDSAAPSSTAATDVDAEDTTPGTSVVSNTEDKAER